MESTFMKSTFMESTFAKPTFVESTFEWMIHSQAMSTMPLSQFVLVSVSIMQGFSLIYTREDLM